MSATNNHNANIVAGWLEKTGAFPTPPAISTEIMEEIKAYIECCTNVRWETRLQCCTVKQAADYMQVEPDTIRAYINTGKLPAIKATREYSIRCEDLMRFMNEHSTTRFLNDRRRAALRNQSKNSCKIKTLDHGRI